MSIKNYIPKPVFQTLEDVIDQYKLIQSVQNPSIINDWLNVCLDSVPDFSAKDYQYALSFLYSYRGSSDTFVAYRRDLERFIQWSWFIKEQSVLSHKRQDIEEFIEFCLKPPNRWIGFKKVARFKKINGETLPNPEWRPFEVRLTKLEHRKGTEKEKKNFQFSQEALKALFGVLGSFYSFLIQEEITASNPINLIRQKSKFIQKQTTRPIRRLSNEQWELVLSLARKKAEENNREERSVFILSLLYGMYLRISELSASSRWTSTMEDFYKDSENNWWFKTIGKGNKARQIAVSPAMLSALKDYRTRYLNLSPLPTLGEKMPLIGHVKNPNKPIRNTRPLRETVQKCFDAAAEELEQQGKIEDANSLRIATVHWLRHTGISEDVKIRPREHVRDDAGHSSSAITDKYIDIERRERANSAQQKRI